MKIDRLGFKELVQLTVSSIKMIEKGRYMDRVNIDRDDG